MFLASSDITAADYALYFFLLRLPTKLLTPFGKVKGFMWKMEQTKSVVKVIELTQGSE